MFRELRSRVHAFTDGAKTAMAENWWRFRFVAVRFLVVLAIFVTLVWVSLFLYGSFYYAYMPPVSHTRDINLQFSSECDSPGILCSFPTANVTLAPAHQIQLLMQGQPYRVTLDLEMPESPVNQNLGMFMVNLQFYARHGKLLETSSKSALLRYKSFLLQTIETFFFSPYLLLGYQEQKQMVSVVMFENYQEDAYKAAVGAYIQVLTKRIQIYSATLRIHASFSGLRYLLYNWPMTSAFVGISINMFFLVIMGLLSWWRYLVLSSETTEPFKFRQRKKPTSKSQSSPPHLESSESSNGAEKERTHPHKEEQELRKSDLEKDLEVIDATETIGTVLEKNDENLEIRLRKSVPS